jgi:hypothetical protein
MGALLEPTQVSCKAEGSTVVLTIGNHAITMTYETALVWSRMLRVRGKEAKRNAGDTSRHWTSVGTLETLESLRELEKQWWR